MTRVYGRVPTDTAGGDGEIVTSGSSYKWVAVETGPDGTDDYPMITALVQCLRLNLGEAPFYGQDGIPAKAAITQQIAPDFAVARIQRKYAPYFASLVISKQPLDFSRGQTPQLVYNIFIIRNNGSTYRDQVGL